jgi:RNA polymerase sigma factor (sigma-70 family)
MAKEQNETQVVRWVLLAQSGDQEAQAQLLGHIHERLYSCIFRMVGRHEDLADECVREMVVRILEDLPKLREPERFQAWATVIACNLVKRYLPRERRFSAHPGDTEKLEELPWREKDEEVRDLQFVREGVEELSPKSREVVWLRFWRGLKLREIAESLQIPVDVVKARLKYGVDTLRDRLDWGTIE